MAKRIPVSFKENERDTKLLLEINTHSDKSAFIKDAVQFYMIHAQKTVPLLQTHSEFPDMDENNEILSIMS